MEIRGELTVTLTHKSVSEKTIRKKKELIREFRGDFTVTRKQCEKIFGKDYARAAFSGQVVTKVGNEEEISWDSKSIPILPSALGAHAAAVDKYEFSCRPKLGEVVGVTGADRVHIGITLQTEKQDVSFFLEKNLNNPLKMTFRSIDDEELQEPLPGTAA